MAGGALISGAIYFSMHQRILNRTLLVSTDLRTLSQDLETLAPPAVPDHADWTARSNTRPPLGDLVKSQWNDTLIGATAAIYRADYGQLARQAYDTAARLTRRITGSSATGRIQEATQEASLR
ncbi:hypothetical protein E5Q_00750 [Mixia osmundae IAM 14324]|uniref:MICOS complex subunit MIC12 n=1 Tax=Mixia osmundae (strain CBS 9802 / IAM 14324 / JCM 22182 / KY 12970) TaxID=764103 RepID=G7DU43_MIXOS|nr:hypothetical protein E5Q_00750 [Mixia osmundae IAM 14324]